MNRYSRSI